MSTYRGRSPLAALLKIDLGTTSRSASRPSPSPPKTPASPPPSLTRIRDLAEQLDAHRKARQAAHESVTLTGLYNVLAKLRRAEPLTAKDKLLHEQGLVGVLHSLHEELDAAVLAAYGWSDLGPVPWTDDEAHRAWTEALLQRLVALNAKRAAEEANGLVRWLRPEFQDPQRRSAATPAATAAQQPPLPDTEDTEEGLADGSSTATAAARSPARQTWPAALPEQMRAVAELLAAQRGAPLTEAALAERFSGRGPWKKRLPSLLVEFKSDRKRLPDAELVEAVVCLANAEGGELWLGVEDDGTPTGLHADHRLLTGLAGMVAARTSPPR
jgi:hypothetical protein